MVMVATVDTRAGTVGTAADAAAMGEVATEAF
jgi:hypothetical protein